MRVAGDDRGRDVSGAALPHAADMQDLLRGNVCMPGDTDTACGGGAVTACRNTQLGRKCVNHACQ